MTTPFDFVLVFALVSVPKRSSLPVGEQSPVPIYTISTTRPRDRQARKPHVDGGCGT